MTGFLRDFAPILFAHLITAFVLYDFISTKRELRESDQVPWVSISGSLFVFLAFVGGSLASYFVADRSVPIFDFYAKMAPTFSANAIAMVFLFAMKRFDDADKAGDRGSYYRSWLVWGGIGAGILGSMYYLGIVH